MMWMMDDPALMLAMVIMAVLDAPWILTLPLLSDMEKVSLFCPLSNVSTKMDPVLGTSDVVCAVLRKWYFKTYRRGKHSKESIIAIRK